jgi:hypothetical protein
MREPLAAGRGAAALAESERRECSSLGIHRHGLFEYLQEHPALIPSRSALSTADCSRARACRPVLCSRCAVSGNCAGENLPRRRTPRCCQPRLRST